MATLEAKRASTDPMTAQDQGRHYAEQLEVPFVFLSNGEEVWFLDRNPCPEAAIPAWRSVCVVTLSPSIAPGREPGNTSPSLRPSAHALRSPSSA